MQHEPACAGLHLVGGVALVALDLVQHGQAHAMLHLLGGIPLVAQE